MRKPGKNHAKPYIGEASALITPGKGEIQMLHWSLIFLVLAVIAAILGFGGIAGTAVGIAKALFFIFLVIWLIGLILGRRSV
jgi:uncharacterized membrane protein YtjA (UPF0391 family)